MNCRLDHSTSRLGRTLLAACISTALAFGVSATYAQTEAPGATTGSGSTAPPAKGNDANRSAGASKGNAVTPNPGNSSSDMGGKSDRNKPR